MKIDLPQPIQVSSPPDLRQELSLPSSATCAAGVFKIQRFLLTDGPRAGVELLVIDTGKVRAALCPTRGMSLWRARMDGLDCGWSSPVEGPIHPSFVALDESSGLGWLDGFDELLVRCGLRSFGAPDFDEQGNLKFALHGRVGNLPAREVEIHVDPEHSLLEVRGEVHESRFLQYNLRLKSRTIFAFNEPSIEIRDRVENAGATPTTMQMLYHINLGAPILDTGAKMHVDAERVVARNAHAAKDIQDWQTYLPPTAGYEEQVYFFASRAANNGWARAFLASKDASHGFAVHYKPESLPYFTQWKNTVASSDGYVTGLEPGTGFPNPRSFEEAQQRVVQLGPQAAIDFHLKLEATSSSDRVRQIVTQMTGDRTTAIAQETFDPQWCTPRSE